MSKMFEEEAKVLSALEMSSAMGGFRDEKLCGCPCAGTQAESDSIGDANHVKENQTKIEMP
jgi:hypothetical protein